MALKIRRVEYCSITVPGTIAESSLVIMMSRGPWHLSMKSFHRRRLKFSKPAE